MSINCWVAIFIAILFSIITAKPVSLHDPDATRRLEQHRNLTAQFRCSAPQLRSYKIKEMLLLTGQIESSASIIPYYTLIRTCDEGSGCCTSPAMTCGPARVDGVESEDVIVKQFHEVGDGVSGLKILRIQHHKKCECHTTSGQAQSSPVITLIN